MAGLKRSSIAFVITMLIATLASCAVPSQNNEAKQAYEKVLEQYKEASRLTYEEYLQREEEFPYVCEIAMRDYYTSMGGLSYGYFDLNGDGLDELIIGSDREREEIMSMTEVDIFVYHDGQVYSVIDNQFKTVNDSDEYYPSMPVSGPGIYKKNTIYIKRYEDPYKIPGDPSLHYHKSEIFLFELNEEGEALEMTKCQISEDDHYYQYDLNVKPSYDEFIKGFSVDSLREISFEEFMGFVPWEYFTEEDIPYKALISN